MKRKGERDRTAPFREGDKVMQVKNNYQLEWEILGRYKIPVDKGVGVFNGDTGIMTEINEFAETATVEFEDGRQAEYSFKQLEELELAYAVTIHKSQGSEYPAVILPILSGPRMLMNRNLLYTAVTRARKCVTVVGSETTFAEMIRNENSSRDTALWTDGSGSWMNLNRRRAPSGRKDFLEKTADFYWTCFTRKNARCVIRY